MLRIAATQIKWIFLKYKKIEEEGIDKFQNILMTEWIL